MAKNREIGGIWCMQVLAALDSYVDGEIPPDTLKRVQAHVAECSWCASFGAQYAATIEAIKAEPTSAESSDAIEAYARQILERAKG